MAYMFLVVKKVASVRDTGGFRRSRRLFTVNCCHLYGQFHSAGGDEEIVYIPEGATSQPAVPLNAVDIKVLKPGWMEIKKL